MAQIYPSGDISNDELNEAFGKHFSAYRRVKGLTKLRQKQWRDRNAPMGFLYVTVMTRGGFNAIDGRDTWRDIYLYIMALSYDPRCHRNVWKAARDLYEQYLREFEPFMKNLGATAQDPLMLTVTE